MELVEEARPRWAMTNRRRRQRSRHPAHDEAGGASDIRITTGRPGRQEEYPIRREGMAEVFNVAVTL